MTIEQKIEQTSSGEANLWCYGLPSSGSRKLVPAERRRLRGSYLRSKVHFALSAALLPIVPAPAIAFYLSGPSLPLKPLWLEALALVALAAVFLLLPAALYMIARGSYRRADRLSRDLGRSEVLRFEGSLEDYELDDRGRELARRGLFETGSGTLQSVEALPESGTVLKINDYEIAGRFEAPISEAAAPPENPHVVYLSPDLLEGEWFGVKELFRRRLSGAEEADLRGLITQRQRPPWLLVAMGVLNLLALALYILPEAPGFFQGWFQEFRIAFLFLFGLFLLLCLGYGKSLLEARSLERDLEAGFIVIVPPKRARKSGALMHTPLARWESITKELLPFSLSLWTIRGRPSDWRRKRT